MALLDNSAGSISRRAQELLDTESLTVDIEDPSQAAEFFEGAGVCVFPDVFSTALMDSCSAWLRPKFAELDNQLASRNIDLHEPFRFNEVCRRRFGRYDTRGVGIDGPHFEDKMFGDQNPLLPFVNAVLGDEAVELWRGVVDNRKGSEDQSWHRDGDHIFEHTHLPTHCLTLFIPLVDITEACGPTDFYPGSHAAWRYFQYSQVNEGNCHVPFCTPLCTRGSAIAFDYRTVHRGTANIGDTDRPIFYMVFARPWFKDHNNFPADAPLFPPPSPLSLSSLSSSLPPSDPPSSSLPPSGPPSSSPPPSSTTLPPSSSTLLSCTTSLSPSSFLLPSAAA